MTAIFWIGLAFVAYVYAGYAALLAAWTRVKPAPPLNGDTTDLPAISIVIAARNEGARIVARIENLLDADYPSARQIIVVSDGSTDDTLAALARFRSAVDVIALERGGKAVALNAGVSCARHPLLVFADARQTFARDALIELARPFADPRIGAVSGALMLDDDTRATVGSAVGLYWRLEKQIRQLESDVGSTMGVTGAVYAMRRSLWSPLPPATILDDVLAPMRCVLAGSRIVFNGRALAFDRLSANADDEARRKRRTLAGNYQILWLEPRLLSPWSNPAWPQYVSHKLGRLLVPYAALAIIVASLSLAPTSAFYATAVVLESLFVLLALYGAWVNASANASRARRLLARPAVVAFTFVRMNYEAVAGLAALLLRRNVWRTP